MDTLPQEMITNILSFLTLKDRVVCERVSHGFKSSCRQLWSTQSNITVKDIFPTYNCSSSYFKLVIKCPLLKHWDELLANHYWRSDKVYVYPPVVYRMLAESNPVLEKIKVRHAKDLIIYLRNLKSSLNHIKVVQFKYLDSDHEQGIFLSSQLTQIRSLSVKSFYGNQHDLKLIGTRIESYDGPLRVLNYMVPCPRLTCIKIKGFDDSNELPDFNAVNFPVLSSIPEFTGHLNDSILFNHMTYNLSSVNYCIPNATICFRSLDNVSKNRLRLFLLSKNIQHLKIISFGNCKIDGLWTIVADCCKHDLVSLSLSKYGNKLDDHSEIYDSLLKLTFLRKLILTGINVHFCWTERQVFNLLDTLGQLEKVSLKTILDRFRFEFEEYVEKYKFLNPNRGIKILDE